jgi:DNA-binding transcriptional regulator YdaS (Cro superfamily)
MNPLERAIKVCGTQQKLADLIGGIRQSHVSMWLHRGKVPADYCPTIERVTGGAVRCEDLRPDVEWAVLRGRIKSPSRPIHGNRGRF